MNQLQAEETRIGYGSNGLPLPSCEIKALAKKIAGDTILLSFSRGKDSIAMWLDLRKEFNIIPYYMYWVPGLEYEEESLQYYERFFGCHITRVPHPYFYKHLNNFMFQPPERVAVIRAVNMPNFTFADMDDMLAKQFGLDNPFTAIGMRAADGIDRRNMIHQMGALGTKSRRYFYSIWDWDIKQTASIINDNDCKIPLDYRVYGRTLASWDYQYIKPMKKHFPRDYQKLVEWFPFIELEFFRYEKMEQS